MKLHTPSALLGAIVVSILGLVTAFAQPQMTIQPIPCGLTQAQQDVLALLSVVYIDDCQGGPGYKTLRVDGANLQVVNGLGTTDSTNGLGNILIGYQENTAVLCDRSGSHNLIGGIGNDYSTYGGLVCGLHNYLDAGYSAILGGSDNVVSTTPSTVIPTSVIIGGQWNTTTSDHAVIVGGGFNLIDGFAGDINAGRWSTIVGGGGVASVNGNIIQGSMSTILGGGKNLVSNGTSSATVVGGRENTALGTNSVVSGGLQRSAIGLYDWVAGSLFEDQ